MVKEMISLKSANGASEVKGVLYKPEKPAKALIQISHGMVEYIGRYEDFMNYLVNNGYAVCAHDHIGHGNSVGKDETFGYFKKEDGDQALVDDLYEFGQLAKKQLNQSVPFILLGHSMGSFIARICVVKYPDTYDGFIISGTGGPSALSSVGPTFASIVKKVSGEKKQSEKLDNILFGSFNKKIDNARTSKDWLSRDPDVVDAYLKDPFSSFIFTTSAFKDLASLTKKANDPKWFSSVSKTMPILMISGDKDPVGNYGKGVLEVYNRLKENGCQISIILYEDGRHEMLNEINKQDVYQDILNWLNEIIK